MAMATQLCDTRADAIESIVMEDVAPAAPETKQAKRHGAKQNGATRETPDGVVLCQSVHTLISRTQRKNAMASMTRYMKGYREDVLKLRQDDMAFVLGVSRMTYQRMEAGHPGVAIEAWLRAMQLLQHLGTLSEMDLARDRATYARIKKDADAALARQAADKQANPKRYFG